MSESMIKHKRSRETSRSQSKESVRSHKKMRIDEGYKLVLKTCAVEASNKVNCTFCSREISRSIKIICAECEDCQYCLDCLVQGLGKEGKDHHHDYHVADKLNFNLLTRDWTAFEELNLLSNIEKFGLDNWTDIHENMGNKSKYQCEAHYYKFYYKSQTDFLPSACSKAKLEENSQLEENQTKICLQNAGKIPEFTTGKDNKNNRSRSLVKNRNRKDQTSIKSASEVLGYWPKREEFDVEYSNDAELEIAELEFLEEDTPEEYRLKMDILNVYNAQLDERQLRKKFVIERNFLDIKKHMNFERKLTKDDREIYNSLKPFARFFDDHASFLEFFEGIVLEKNLKQRLNQLKQYKRHNLKTYEDIEKYLEYESRHKKEESKKNPMMIEACGLGARINRFLQNTEEFDKSKDKDREKDFLKSLNLPKSTYYDIKKKINKELINEKDSKIILNKLSPKYDIDKEITEGIVDFVISLNNTGINNN